MVPSVGVDRALCAGSWIGVLFSPKADRKGHSRIPRRAPRFGRVNFSRSLLPTTLLALITAGLASPANAAPNPASKVTVFGQDNQIVAEFTTAKCGKPHGSFVALTPRVNGYRLFVSIEKFSGFHTYDLVRGPEADPYVSMTVNGEAAFSTLYVPPFPLPGFGQVRFSPKGKRMGVGFQPMLNQAGTDGVVFAGAVQCQYKKRGK